MSIEEDVANDCVLFDIYSLQSAVNYLVEGSVNPKPIDFRVWDPPRARLLGQQKISPQKLTYLTVRRPRGKVVHANLHAITMRLATSEAQDQKRVTTDPPYPLLWTMAIVEAGD